MYENKLETKIISQETLDILKSQLPYIFTENNKINFELLKQHLGEKIEDNKEFYSFKWVGKEECIKLIQQPTTATLNPDENKSINFNETNNIFIEGDNLEVLKILQKSYYKEIDIIYIDPPYNKDKDFVYTDKWSDGLDTYLNYTGLKEEGKIISSKAFSNETLSGSKHSKWLSMMYPRLFLARNLLKKEGVIFISIDDVEETNLKKICDEIFGEENYLAKLTIPRYTSQNMAKYFSSRNEFMLVYCKSKIELDKKIGKFNEVKNGFDIVDKIINDNKNNKNPEEVLNLVKEYYKSDNKLKGISSYNKINKNYELYRGLPLDNPKNDETKKYEILHPITQKTCSIPSNGWRLKKEDLIELITKNEIIFGIDEKTIPQRIKLLKDVVYETPKTIIDIKYKDGSLELKDLDLDNLFDFPKSTDLLSYIFKLYSYENKDITILDFFGGSGSTAHSIFKTNLEDSGKRKFILVQLPEVPDFESSENKKQKLKEKFDSLNLKNIADLTRERIKRAGIKIKKDNKSNPNINTLDIGYKTFVLSESNFKEQETITEEDFINTKDIDIKTIKDNKSKIDIFYQTLILKGLKLDSQLNKIVINNQELKDTYEYKDYYDNKEIKQHIVFCLNDSLTLENIKGLKDINPKEIVFIESYLQKDIKLNIKHILQKQFNISIFYI